MSLGVLEMIVSAEPLIVFDADTRVVHLNHPAEVLLGTTAAEAVGKSCQAVLHGRGPGGRESCAPACRESRYARQGRPVPRMQITIDTAAGPRLVAVSTVVLVGEDGPLLCRVLHDQTDPSGDPSGAAPTTLTARQVEVLHLLAGGMTAQNIALRLGITEATARNHIRAVLIELDAHSQLQAVARARDLGIVG